MEQEAPSKKTMRDVWDLIIGPEATPWSSLLVQDHVECDGRLALFQTCRGGRELVLTTAEQATLKVAAREGAQLQAAKIALVTRGNLPTMLHLTATDEPEQVPLALGALGEGTTWLDELVVECRKTLPCPVLAIVGRCCPKLRALDIKAAIDQLPSAELFPNLKQLRITDPTRYSSLSGDQRQLHSQRVRLAAAPYIKQLTYLSLCSPDYIPTLLSPANIATHLCSLDLRHSRLDDALLGLLLQCAPALEQLAVHSIELQSDVHVHTPATWRQLQYYDGYNNLRVSSLGRLPDTAPGLLLVCPRGSDRMLKCDTAILDDEAVARVQGKQFRWEGDGDNVFLDHIHGVDSAAALRLGLTMLHCWVKADGSPLTSLTIYGKWTMTRELMVELHTGLPRWQRLEFHLYIDWLPEEPHLYASLLRLLPDTYRDVIITFTDGDESSLTFEQIVSICCGAPTRTAEAPLRIRLEGCYGYQAIQDRMQQFLIPNVVVVQG